MSDLAADPRDWTADQLMTLIAEAIEARDLKAVPHLITLLAFKCTGRYWPWRRSAGKAQRRERVAMTIDEARAHIGDGVVYHPVREADEGVITSVSDRWVFVDYGTQGHSEATDPADLTLLAGG